ncbi:MAG: hypothetical protein MI922_22025, partial [Bacteroidales bacterium]|nr:hypothetical protein [Bacteroidales bacterium]
MKNFYALFLVLTLISTNLFADITSDLVVHLELNGDSSATIGPKVYSPDTLYGCEDKWGNASGAMDFPGAIDHYLYMT